MTPTAPKCISMPNPWLELLLKRPYILKQDLARITKINNKRSAKGGSAYRINLNSLPEPYIGDPQTARVILLNLNPGDVDEDRQAHRKPTFRTAILSNLQHERQEYPFYPLDPKLASTPCAQWWLKHLRELFEKDKGGLDKKTVAQRLCVIEWFPYHSQKTRLPINRVCLSQDYSFDMARRALGTALVVGMRARNRWTAVDPRFKSVPFLKNPQNFYISVGNAGEELFHRIVAALRK